MPTRIWTRQESEALFQRIVGLTNGRGHTSVTCRMSWKYTLAWGRNRPTQASVTRHRRVILTRVVGDKSVTCEVDDVSDAAITQTVADAERRLQTLKGKTQLSEDDLPAAQQYATPPIWSDTTFSVPTHECAQLVQRGVALVDAAKFLASGSMGTKAESWAIFNTKGGAAYSAGTAAVYSQIVRDGAGTAAGWAGGMQTDWSKLDVAALSASALQKCAASVNPRSIEPGRYVALLEPQVVGELFLLGHWNDMVPAVYGTSVMAAAKKGTTRIGHKVLDERITISSDPMDPDCPYMPFDEDGYPHRPVTWVEHGVLKNLGFQDNHVRRTWQVDVPLQSWAGYRMSGGAATLDDMIATTDRGVLVTALTPWLVLHTKSYTEQGWTRNGLWLIENGKITHAIRNMRVRESPFFVGNKIEELGKPERVFGVRWNDPKSDNTPVTAFGNFPIVVPPLRVRDFNFVAVSNAV